MSALSTLTAHVLVGRRATKRLPAYAWPEDWASSRPLTESREPSVGRAAANRRLSRWAIRYGSVVVLPIPLSLWCLIHLIADLPSRSPIPGPPSDLISAGKTGSHAPQALSSSESRLGSADAAQKEELECGGCVG